ncbi:MAG: PorT family protein [Saprospiraceae bacterium]|nr:PorT family protein [Saprospiraceae bacterium]MBK6565323.1 PorT family protein [Saprospiraceae bacterium]MBK6785975.1 PorT family protein [Saprospiraceae bacterium]MBK8371142.1 PorT family protein [Saprospiraceae bacterium]MBK8546074.1 PorT family protein [Saprospiraceae bacterium]
MPTIQAQIGIRVGADLSTFYFSESVDLDTKHKFGLGGGIYYKHMVNNNFSIQPELNFIQMGTKFEENDEEGSISLHYLQLPILAKYDFGNMEAINIFVQGGPYVGYGIGKVELEYCFDGECDVEEINYDSSGEEAPKPLDFGLQLGLGVNINKKISIDARYILGLQNLNAEDEGSIKNRAIFVSVGYTF